MNSTYCPYQVSCTCTQPADIHASLPKEIKKAWTSMEEPSCMLILKHACCFFRFLSLMARVSCSGDSLASSFDMEVGAAAAFTPRKNSAGRLGSGTAVLALSADERQTICLVNVVHIRYTREFRHLHFSRRKFAGVTISDPCICSRAHLLS